jgi:molybdopterin synthase sulfur carrier subunit
MADRPTVTVQVPGSLRELTGGREEITVEAGSVDEVLDHIRRTEPLLAGRLFADDGRIRGYINVFVDGTELRHLGAGRRDVGPGAVLSIVPSVAGG